jgi:asparagine synthase (glutamine-hydrolysing)
MCGIAGFIGLGGIKDICAMTAAMAHRGPDDEGFFSDAETGLYFGHRRLSILDVKGGKQPMWNEDGTVCVVYNGEIYNHRELREELLNKGHVFRSSHSDTEVLVHGYEEWDRELLPRLNGMFAFALFDRPRRRILLGRDRFGEKPLYYARRKGLFAFASELTALTCHSLLQRTISGRSVKKYLAYGFIPAPNAFYEDCFKLPAGAILFHDLATDQTSVSQYWRFQIETDERLADEPEEGLAEELRSLLKEAVKRRMVSDAPLGFSLSGGIDSSTVLALASELAPDRLLRSFTVGFVDPSFDESFYARRVSEIVGSKHTEEVLTADSAVGIMPMVLSRLDEPLADPSILPSYLLSSFTRQHVTVALSGDGSDELLGGYDPFKALRIAQLYARVVPKALHDGFRCLADLLPLSDRNMSLDFKIRRALTGLAYPCWLWNPVWLGPLEPSGLEDLLNEKIVVEEVYSEALEIWHKSEAKEIGDKTMEFYTNLYLPDDILFKVDRASMMVSLESRSVFLDNDVVEFLRRLPFHLKYRNGSGKYLLKRAMAGRLPKDILKRRKKGFGIPVRPWLRRLHWPALTGLGQWRESEPMMARLISEDRLGAKDHRLALWAYLSLCYLSPGPKAAVLPPEASCSGT